MIHEDHRKKDPKSFLYTDFYYVDRRGRKREKRRYRRFQCRKDLMVFCGDLYGRIRDISLGGLSFSILLGDADYAPKNRSGEKDDFDVICKSKDLIVPALPAEIIYDYHVRESDSESNRLYYRKYYGIRFSGLSARQDFRIKSLILKGAYL